MTDLIQSPILSKENRLIPDRFSPDALHFILTAGTEKIEPNTILFRLDQLTKARSQLSILRLRQITFKNTVLHPLPIGLENLVNLSPALVFRNVVADHDIHSATSAPRVDIYLFLAANTSPTTLPEFQTILDKYIGFAAPDA
jgi:hypothetical protein